MRDKITYIFIAIILLLLVRNNFDIKLKSNESTSIDSTEVVNIIPESKGEFKQIKKPNPIIVNNYISNDKQLKNLIKNLEKKYNEKTDSTIILRELLQATKVRKYKETFEDSLQIATVNAETTGTLNSIDFSYIKKPQKTTYFEKTITKKLKPKLSLLLGGKINTSTSLNSSSFEVNVGMQSKNGSLFEIGYNTNNQVSIGYKLPLFTKY